MPKFKVTYRSGRVTIIEAPNPTSAREIASYRGDVMDPKGVKVVKVERQNPHVD